MNSKNAKTDVLQKLEVLVGFLVMSIGRPNIPSYLVKNRIVNLLSKNGLSSDEVSEHVDKFVERLYENRNRTQAEIRKFYSFVLRKLS